MIAIKIMFKKLLLYLKNKLITLKKLHCMSLVHCIDWTCDVCKPTCAREIMGC